MSGRLVVLLVALLAVAALSAPQPRPAARRRLGLEWLHRRLPPPPPLKVTARVAEELFIDQLLDHLDDTNTQTWSQRYFRNTDYYVEGGPVFVFIGGEGTADASWVEGGYMAYLASQYGALALELEHRYYGQSRPTEDASTENLQYLSALQALEDLAYFIRLLRQQSPELDAAKWIVFGGSYAGNLAAWARLRYPDIIDGAVASSGPVLAQANFLEYLEVVAEAIGTYDQQCLTDIAAATAEFEELLTTDEGVATINEIFELCEPLDTANEYDVAGLTSYAISEFSGAVQYNSVYTGFTSTIEQYCNAFAAADGDTPLRRLLSFMGFGVGAGCADPSYEESLVFYQQDGWNNLAAALGYRQWFYQTCNEFGYYQTTDSELQPFGNRITLPYYEDMCTGIFGADFTATRVDEGVAAVNELYGALNPDVTNVVFVNGGLDPWHRLSVLEDLNESTPAVYIEGESHCSDMYAPSVIDPPQLQTAHEQIEALVAQWIAA